MLIDFTVENYRSIKEPVTLSAIAQNYKTSLQAESKRRSIKPEDDIAKPFSIKGRGFNLLPVLGIFGANASGKSNVLQALDDLIGFIAYHSEAKNYNRLYFATPFKLHSLSAKSPTKFEFRVVREANIYSYTLVLNNIRVLEEKLDYIPASSKRMQYRLLFSRQWSDSLDTYVLKNGQDFGNSFKKIQESLRANQNFLSFLVSSLKVAIVQPFTSWLDLYWTGVSSPLEEEEDLDLAAFLLKESSPQVKRFIYDLIKRFDTGIDDFEIVEAESESEEDKKRYDIFVSHKTDKKSVKWLLSQESLGTQRLFTLATKMLDAFSRGSVMFVDEFGSNIHPNITRTIIRLFQSEISNPLRAQLIFTSHDNTLQRNNLLRRDQIWFTQKRKNGSTELYPLSDFSPRNDLAIDKAYLDGRFGAIPILPNEEELFQLSGAVK